MAQTKQLGPYEVLELPKRHGVRKEAVLSVRIDADLKRRLDEACDAGPYRITQSSLVQRGIELAIEELAAALRKKMETKP